MIDSYTILNTSDTHLGYPLTRHGKCSSDTVYVQGLDLAVTLSLERGYPLVHNGDILDSCTPDSNVKGSPYLDAFDTALGRLSRQEEKLYLVPGNHDEDRYHRDGPIAFRHPWYGELKNQDAITFLDHEPEYIVPSVAFYGLTLAGVDDTTNPRRAQLRVLKEWNEKVTKPDDSNDVVVLCLHGAVTDIDYGYVSVTDIVNSLDSLSLTGITIGHLHGFENGGAPNGVRMWCPGMPAPWPYLQNSYSPSIAEITVATDSESPITVNELSIATEREEFRQRIEWLDTSHLQATTAEQEASIFTPQSQMRSESDDVRDGAF